ncbi:MAG: DUF1778 domain-containing protein [Burkholderiales bacterium]
MPTPAQTRQITINLRARTPQRELIDRAAESLGKTRTEFMLEAACQKAQEVLVDQTVFMLDQRRFKRFLELLGQPIAQNKGLTKLLASRSPWDK